jgi:hypothetical protein
LAQDYTIALKRRQLPDEAGVIRLKIQRKNFSVSINSIPIEANPASGYASPKFNVWRELP